MPADDALTGMAIEAHLKEARSFPPPDPFRRQANVKDPDVYDRAAEDPEAFWADFAAELQWSRRWEKVLAWDPPHAKWFVGGRLNASVNCVDRHLGERGGAPAFLWEGEPGDRRVVTYRDVHREVCRFANALRRLGVARGDRVTLYLPMVPELPVAMLACARIGAAHNVVFGGFSPTALAHRMDDAKSRVLITCDAYYRAGKVIPQKERADEAVGLVEETDVEHVVVVNRMSGDAAADLPGDVPWRQGRDIWWHDAVAKEVPECEPVEMDSEDLLFIMYTSGSTGRPKGIVHTTGGYLTGTYATSKWIFDLKPDDVYWCMADIGWITGHSYIVYGPMLNGATQVMFEGAPTYPSPARPWEIVARYGVTVFYTAPTAIRTFMRAGERHVKGNDRGSLRLLGSVGEPINPEAWMWYRKVVGEERCPIVDTWWQTETGAIMISPLPGITTTKPGSATRPFPGIDAAVLDDSGNEVPPGAGGLLAVRRPWPSMLRGIWGDEDRFRKQYWSKWPGVYYTSDGARRDADGYFWVMGRMDDVMNVSGHRLSTMEIESALVGHAKVVEAAVIGAPDDVKGTVPVAFTILADGVKPSESIRKELVSCIEKEIGAIARPRAIVFVPDLPKTRSGKIMRRLLVDVVAGRPLGDTTTLADPDVPRRIKETYDELRA